MTEPLSVERIEQIRERFELVRNSLSGPAEATLSRDALDLLSALSQSQARVAELEAEIEKHRDICQPHAIQFDFDERLWSVLPQGAPE